MGEADRAHGQLPHCGITDGAQQWVLIPASDMECDTGGLLGGSAVSPSAPTLLYLHDLGVAGHVFLLGTALHSEF